MEVLCGGFTCVLIPADILAHIMNDLFGGVVYAGIDTDRYKYPIGSGRVTFGNQKSFMRAVKAGFVEIKTPKFNKKVGNDLTVLSHRHLTAMCLSCDHHMGCFLLFSCALLETRM